jgi:hypothetical protein
VVMLTMSQTQHLIPTQLQQVFLLLQQVALEQMPTFNHT